MARITVIARLKAKPNMMGELEKALTQIMHKTHEELGCLHYSLHKGGERSDELITIERWRDRADLDAHMKMPYLVELIAKVPTLMAGAPEISIYTGLDSGNHSKGKIE